MSQNFENMKRRYMQGWRTWQNESVLSHVHMPEGMGIRLYLKDYTRKQIAENTFFGCSDVAPIGFVPNDDPNVCFMRPGANAYDGSYTDVTLTWGKNRMRVQTALDGDDLILLAEPLKQPLRPSCLIISGVVLWDREGSVERKGECLYLNMPSGTTPVYMTAAHTGEKHTHCQAPCLTALLDKAIGISTGKKRTIAEIKTLIAQGRAKWEAHKARYGDWAEAYSAMQTVLSWNTVYAPDIDAPVTPVSRLWSHNFTGSYVLFCWDTYFAAMMLAFDNKELAYSNAITVTNSLTPAGFVPSMNGPDGYRSYDRSQPPVGSMACLWIYNRHKDKWFLRKVYDSLVSWNQWWMEHRLTKNGLLTWGSDPFETVNGFSMEKGVANTKRGATFESGLDNMPMYDGAVFDPETHRLLFDDVGLTGLYIHDCRCLAEIARILDENEKAEMLEKRAAEIEQRLEALWSEKDGLYLNRHTDTNAFGHSLSIVHFHALFSSLAKGERAERMIHEHLLNPEEFWGQYIIPVSSRNDPASKDNHYWRGRIWGPTNFLIYMALLEHGKTELCRELAIKSRDLLMKEWLELGHIHENYDAGDGTGCTLGSDRYYHWGALLSLIGLLENEKGNV